MRWAKSRPDNDPIRGRPMPEDAGVWFMLALLVVIGEDGALSFGFTNCDPYPGAR